MPASFLDLAGIPLLQEDKPAAASLMDYLTRFPIQSDHKASNTIGRATELLTKAALAMSLLPYGDCGLDYRSAYSQEHKDRGGADFRVDVAGTTIAAEAEQRTRGYTTDGNIYHEVTNKLRQEGARHRLYCFFSGYEQQPLDDVIRRANAAEVEVLVLDPMPYTRTLDGSYAFSKAAVVEWFKATLGTLVAKTTYYLRRVLGEPTHRITIDTTPAPLEPAPSELESKGDRGHPSEEMSKVHILPSGLPIEILNLVTGERYLVEDG